MKLELLNALESYIIENGSVKTEDLCDTFSVSKNTLRKYLLELEKRGQVRKVYGGVIAIHMNKVEPETHRASVENDAKNAIGRIAAAMVDDGDVIFLDSGSTVAKIVPWLTQKKNLTIVTNSYPVITEAVKLPNVNLISLGGTYYENTNSFFDEEIPERTLGMNFTKLFLGCMGISIEGGVTNATYYETALKLNVIKKSEKVILVADKTKVGKNALRTLCRVSDLYAFVTDVKPPEYFVKYCKQHKINLVYNHE